jgi:hypothetical protein
MRITSSTNRVLWDVNVAGSAPAAKQKGDIAMRLAGGEVLMAVFRKEKEGTFLFCYNVAFKTFESAS